MLNEDRESYDSRVSHLVSAKSAGGLPPVTRPACRLAEPVLGPLRRRCARPDSDATTHGGAHPRCCPECRAAPHVLRAAAVVRLLKGN